MDFGDLNENKKQFLTLLNGMIKMHESLKGAKIVGNALQLQDAESLYKKVINHCITIFYLIDGSKILDFGINFIDYSSIRILTRAVHEAVLVFNYLFVDPVNQHERDCRYYHYVLNEAIELIDFPFQTISTEHKRDWRKDKKEVIDKCTKMLKRNPIFNSKRPETQNKILKGKVKWHEGWKKLGEKAGLKELHARWNYSFLCGEAHSSSFSLLQLRGIKTTFEKHKIVIVDLQVLMILMSNLIEFFAEIFTSAKEFLKSESNEELRKVMEIWKYVGKEELDE